MNKKSIGFFSGIIVFAVIYLLPIQGLSAKGQMDLALSLMTVVWWAMQIAQPAFVGGLYLMLLIICNVATPSQVFSSAWTGSIMWLVIGAYLIAGAVNESGLGQRIAYAFIIKFVRSWKGIVISIFALTFILALLIPHPWPRAFMIMSVISVVAETAHMPKRDLAKLGLAVFAASCPLSGVFYTGDTSLNPLAVADSGVHVNFVSYFVYMGVPMIIAAVLTMFVFLFMFKPSQEVHIDVAALKVKQAEMGKMTGKEIRTIVWLVIAIALWLTSGITGLDVGWLTLIVALMMSMPVIGGILTAKSWEGVPVNVLVFLTSAIAIGDVGTVTGMNKWIANTVIPSNLPTNIYLLAIFITVFAMIIHMFMGSVIAVMGITIPAFVTATAHMGISPLAVSLLVFTVTNLHYILPFHNLAVLVGSDPDTGGGYTQADVMRLGIPMTGVIFIIALIEMFWFHLVGLA
ncbi:SLC13 family permease [Lactiplantibacillus mudanjiangensis]|uniref:Transport protein [Lactobacillus plantarum JDM1] n=1 Tax=Lactiplantibacillus mudanjiangensis TaxID=1296538 RepID=A0A660E8E2_9LACO|nr:SLC13 family permease [Lactiplantibacillus mudanjiangensis]VDG20172.1 transport protein [Lactobacillus plantarum JDM1] [Lactiplantibacillus mudanjiangensis]VDG24136.1 transport protein [Lactobacillus plantarum JDM1] [Lactiplantibacillus mudanjiangensis]VDG30313.1 transport protein [Lactobacillus plantarum JDM1] [Lactiplantibacillus mudanjiangensis]VDG33566.1 transport protein [Lactobacillus plantarum JDM1] [Lactiplantibacillus mudanjiangensis]